MPKVLKQVIAPGTYWVKGEPVTYTQGDCEHYAQITREMLDAGLPIRLPLEHQSWASDPLPIPDDDVRKARELEFNRGFVSGSFIDESDHSFWAECDVPNEELANRLRTEVKFVSPRFIPEVTDGTGKTWHNVMAHLALTAKPVWHKQKPFGELPVRPVAMSLQEAHQHLAGEPLELSLEDRLELVDGKWQPVIVEPVDLAATWEKYTNPKTNKTGWKSSGGRVVYSADKPGGNKTEGLKEGKVGPGLKVTTRKVSTPKGKTSPEKPKEKPVTAEPPKETKSGTTEAVVKVASPKVVEDYVGKMLRGEVPGLSKLAEGKLTAGAKKKAALRALPVTPAPSKNGDALTVPAFSALAKKIDAPPDLKLSDEQLASVRTHYDQWRKKFPRPDVFAKKVEEVWNLDQEQVKKGKRRTAQGASYAAREVGLRQMLAWADQDWQKSQTAAGSSEEASAREYKERLQKPLEGRLADLNKERKHTDKDGRTHADPPAIVSFLAQLGTSLLKLDSPYLAITPEAQKQIERVFNNTRAASKEDREAVQSMTKVALANYRRHGDVAYPADGIKRILERLSNIGAGTLSPEELQTVLKSRELSIEEMPTKQQFFLRPARFGSVSINTALVHPSRTATTAERQQFHWQMADYHARRNSEHKTGKNLSLAEAHAAAFVHHRAMHTVYASPEDMAAHRKTLEWRPLHPSVRYHPNAFEFSIEHNDAPAKAAVELSFDSLENAPWRRELVGGHLCWVTDRGQVRLRPPVEFAWQSFQTKGGGTGALNTETQKKIYGKQAQTALQRQGQAQKAQLQQYASKSKLSPEQRKLVHSEHAKEVAAHATHLAKTNPDQARQHLAAAEADLKKPNIDEIDRVTSKAFADAARKALGMPPAGGAKPAPMRSAARATQAAPPAPGSPQTGAAGAAAQTSAPEHQAFATFVDSQIERAAHLPPEQRKAYADTMKKVSSSMTPAAVAHMTKNVKAVGFFPDSKTLTQKIAAFSPSAKVALEKGQVVTGCYSNRNGGALILDGGKSKRAGEGVGFTGAGDLDEQRLHTYAHELAHAIDGPNKTFSSTPEWKAIFDKLKGSNVISQYADTSPTEMWAEMGRMIHTQGLTATALKRHSHPGIRAAANYWDKHGLLPKQGKGGRPKKMADVFQEPVVDKEITGDVPLPKPLSTSQAGKAAVAAARRENKAAGGPQTFDVAGHVTRQPKPGSTPIGGSRSGGRWAKTSNAPDEVRTSNSRGGGTKDELVGRRGVQEQIAPKRFQEQGLPISQRAVKTGTQATRRIAKGIALPIEQQRSRDVEKLDKILNGHDQHSYDQIKSAVQQLDKRYDRAGLAALAKQWGINWLGKNPTKVGTLKAIYRRIANRKGAAERTLF